MFRVWVAGIPLGAKTQRRREVESFLEIFYYPIISCVSLVVMESDLHHLNVFPIPTTYYLLP